ncbi:MAG: hypothetical protein ACLVKK_12400 [Ruthenibacterium sp.]
MKKLKQLACGLLAAALLVCALPAAGAEGAGEGQPAPQADGTGAAPVPAATDDGYVEWNGTTDLPASGKVRLTQDVVMGEDAPFELTLTGDLTIDLNGHKLEYAPLLIVPTETALTVEDGSAGQAGCLVASGLTDQDGEAQAFVRVSGGCFTMKGGTFENSTTRESVLVTNGGKAVLQGGSITGKMNARDTALVLVQGTGSEFTMSGGTLTQESIGPAGGFSCSALRLENGAVGNITGGTVSNKAGETDFVAVKVCYNSTVNISGGVVENTGSYNTALEISGGYSEQGKNEPGRAVISGNALIRNTGGKGCALSVSGSGSSSAPGGSVDMQGGTVLNEGENGTAVSIGRTSEYTKGGAFTLGGGTVENAAASGKAVSVKGTLVMNGGELKQADADGAAIYEGGTDSNRAAADITVSGGTVKAEGEVFSLKTARPTVSGGVFNKPVTEYVADGTTAVSVEKGGEAVYAVGGSVAGAVKAAAEGDTVTVLKGDSIEVPDGVKVENETGKDITVNGVNVHNNVVHTAAKAPTAGQGGNIEYWYCEGCGKYFKDAALTQETTAEGVKLPATGSTPAPAPAPAQKANPKTGV